MNKGFSLVIKNGVRVISVDCINETGIFEAYYSTGFDGVSNMPGGCTMNLNIFKENDSLENSIKNFELFSSSVGVSYKSFVAQHEVHSNVVCVVDENDRKTDIFDKSQYRDADGQITHSAIPLWVYGSDCPTLMIADASTGIYGTTHCGWKNTLNFTVRNWIDLFKSEGGSVDCAIVAIGPSLCQDCFEVEDDVRGMFLSYNPDFEKYMLKKGIKTHIDLGGVIRELLIKEGLKDENIHLSGVCTRTDLNLPSYRRDRGANGVMGGVIFKKID